MKLSTKKLIRIILILVFLAGAASRTDLLHIIFNRITGAEAAGSLTIDWGVPAGQPIFTINNFMPGDSESRSVTVTNSTASTQPLSLKGIKIGGTGNLPDQMNITVLADSSPVYGPATLTAFFTASENPDGIPLLSAGPGSSHQLEFQVTFNLNAGNGLQNTLVIFDLQIGVSSLVPSECRHLRFDRIIYGTEGNNRLRGGNKNDLIFGLGGNDRLEGSNSHDCLLGGPGNDRLDGSNGQDILLGGPGNDRLDGSNGNDILLGEDGLDFANGSNGTDYCRTETKTDCEQ